MMFAPEAWIQRLGRRFSVVLCIVALLLLIDQIALQPQLTRLILAAPLINLAGRQRMLSQRIVKCILAIERDPDSSAAQQSELRESLLQWEQAHAQLQPLAVTWGVEAHTSLAQLNIEFDTVKNAAVKRLQGDTNPADSRADLLIHEQSYLAEMELFVTQCERAVQRRVRFLRTLSGSLSVVSLMLLAGMAVWVLQPATRIIRQQVYELAESSEKVRAARDELEERVLLRTRDLQEAHDTLAAAAVAQREADERLRQLQEQLAHAARVTGLGQLATGLAHELNQPLGAIANSSETLDLLLAQPAIQPEPLQQAAGKIRQAALRAGRIVSGLRDLVRPRTGQRSRENLCELVNDVLLLCEPLAREEGVVITRNWTGAMFTAVDVHRIQIQQVVLNIVQNAISVLKDMPASQRRLQIHISRGEQVQLEFIDSGPGFPVMMLGEELLRFQSTRPDGLGLGLSISQSIVHAHAGELRLENIPAGGARVVVTLPAFNAATHVRLHSLCC